MLSSKDNGRIPKKKKEELKDIKPGLNLVKIDSTETELPSKSSSTTATTKNFNKKSSSSSSSNLDIDSFGSVKNPGITNEVDKSVGGNRITKKPTVGIVLNKEPPWIQSIKNSISNNEILSEAQKEPIVIWNEDPIYKWGSFYNFPITESFILPTRKLEPVVNIPITENSPTSNKAKKSIGGRRSKNNKAIKPNITTKPDVFNEGPGIEVHLNLFSIFDEHGVEIPEPFDDNHQYLSNEISTASRLSLLEETDGILSVDKVLTEPSSITPIEIDFHFWGVRDNLHLTYEMNVRKEKLQNELNEKRQLLLQQEQQRQIQESNLFGQEDTRTIEWMEKKRLQIEKDKLKLEIHNLPRPPTLPPHFIVSNIPLPSSTFPPPPPPILRSQPLSNNITSLPYLQGNRMKNKDLLVHNSADSQLKKIPSSSVMIDSNNKDLKSKKSLDNNYNNENKDNKLSLKTLNSKEELKGEKLELQNNKDVNASIQSSNQNTEHGKKSHDSINDKLSSNGSNLREDNHNNTKKKLVNSTKPLPSSSLSSSLFSTSYNNSSKPAIKLQVKSTVARLSPEPEDVRSYTHSPSRDLRDSNPVKSSSSKRSRGYDYDRGIERTEENYDGSRGSRLGDDRNYLNHKRLQTDETDHYKISHKTKSDREYDSVQHHSHRPPPGGDYYDSHYNDHRQNRSSRNDLKYSSSLDSNIREEYYSLESSRREHTNSQRHNHDERSSGEDLYHHNHSTKRYRHKEHEKELSYLYGDNDSFRESDRSTNRYYREESRKSANHNDHYSRDNKYDNKR